MMPKQRAAYAALAPGAFMGPCILWTRTASFVCDRSPCAPAKQCVWKHREAQRVKLCMCEVHV